MPTIRETLKQTTELLKSFRIDSPRLDAEILLAEALGMDRLKLFLKPDAVLGDSEIDRLNTLIEKRMRHEPISLILGHVSFYGRDFVVNSSVLAPRPETEELITWALSLNLPKNALILDMGTGSGCIGITLCCERPNWTVHLNDISPEALKIARLNASHLCQNRIEKDTRLSFHEGNMLDLS